MTDTGDTWAQTNGAIMDELDHVAMTVLMYAITKSVFKPNPMVQDNRTAADIDELRFHIGRHNTEEQEDDRELASMICTFDSHSGEMTHPQFMELARAWADAGDTIPTLVAMKEFFGLEISTEEVSMHVLLKYSTH